MNWLHLGFFMVVLLFPILMVGYHLSPTLLLCLDQFLHASRAGQIPQPHLKARGSDSSEKEKFKSILHTHKLQEEMFTALLFIIYHSDTMFCSPTELKKNPVI